MKTWKLFASLLLCALLVGCSESNDFKSSDDEVVISPADYQVVLSNSEGLYTKHIASTSEGLFSTDDESFLFASSTSSLIFRDGSTIMSYSNTGNCEGSLILYDFRDATELSIPMFSDLSFCQLHVTAITRQTNTIFVSYVMDIGPKEQSFFVRSVDMDTSEYEDYELNKKPVKLVVSNNRLYVLTWDENRTEKNALTVIDLEENSEILEMDMGFKVGTIFKKSNGDIIVSYPDSHTTLDNKSLETTFTRYASGRQPNFNNSENNAFDANGNMYYVRNDSLT